MKLQIVLVVVNLIIFGYVNCIRNEPLSESPLQKNFKITNKYNTPKPVLQTPQIRSEFVNVTAKAPTKVEKKPESIVQKPIFVDEKPIKKEDLKQNVESKSLPTKMIPIAPKLLELRKSEFQEAVKVDDKSEKKKDKKNKNKKKKSNSKTIAVSMIIVLLSLII